MTTQEEKGRAIALLEGLENDPYFMTAGRRNDDAVNLCCACRVIGENPFSHLGSLNLNNALKDDDYEKAVEHVKRVYPYAEGWGPEGNEGNALKYTIEN